jgi:Domain of unknown function (DUF4159)
MRPAVLVPMLSALLTGNGMGGRQEPAPQEQQPAQVVPPGRAFYFTRAVYTSYGRWRPSWAVDYPKADVQFLYALRRLTGLDAYELENPVALDDPELRRFPFLYAVEVGRMALTEAEVDGLRGYLLAGGFLVVDDFWGTREWENFESEMRRVLPERAIVELPQDHPLLNTFYGIDSIVQVPNVGNGMRGGPTWERDGYVPHLRAIFDDGGRLMVLISWNSDLGDAWEWAENPHYPLPYSNYAISLGVNLVLYGMSR